MISFVKTSKHFTTKAYVPSTSISPAMVETRLLANYHDRAREIMAQDHPMKRLALADEVAAVIEAIATGAGAYMSGANIIVNGGSEF